MTDRFVVCFNFSELLDQFFKKHNVLIAKVNDRHKQSIINKKLK